MAHASTPDPNTQAQLQSQTQPQTLSQIQTQAPSPIISYTSSVVSDSFSISAKSASCPTYLLNPSPQPEYVSQADATRIASQVQLPPIVTASERPEREDEGDGDESEDVEHSMTVVSVAAVGLLNLFLDKLLYDIFNSARSTNKSALTQSALTVLRKSLGTDAVAAAESNLQDLLAADDDSDDDQDDADDAQLAVQSARRESMSKWHQEHAWKRYRLRIMMRSELSEFDIDDDERCAQNLVDGDHRTSPAPAKLALSLEIFLAGIIDFVAAHFVTLAATLAVARAHRRSLRTKAPPTSHTLVEESDVEKSVLNSPLDRTWRAWRKSLRSRPYSTTSQQNPHLSASTASSPNVGTHNPNVGARDDLALPGTMPGAFIDTPGEWHPSGFAQMPDIPETAHPDPLKSHPKERGHSSDPTGAKWATRPSRRQSGPVNKRGSAVGIGLGSSESTKQRSASLPVIPPFVPKVKPPTQAAASGSIDEVPIADGQPESDPAVPDRGLHVTRASDGRKPSTVSAVSSHLSEMSTPEIVNGFETGHGTAGRTYSAGAATLVRHISPKSKEESENGETQSDVSPEDISPQDRGAAVSPKARKREAAVGVDYQDGTTVPQSSVEQILPASETSSPSIGRGEPAVPASAPKSVPEPQVPQEPVHISKIRAQRAQSEGRQGGVGPSRSASSSPKLGFRARATSTSKAEISRHDSLRRLAAENSNTQVALGDDDRNRVVTRSPLLGSTRSVHSVDDFDALIAGGETIKLTLSPQSVREGSIEPVIVTRASQASRGQDRKPSGSTPLMGADMIEEEGSPDANGNPKARSTFPRPQHLRSKSIGRQSHQARDATVQNDSMLDFAEFIRSTGPNNQPQPADITALPRPVKTVDAPGRSGDRARLGTSNGSRAMRSPEAPAVTSRTGLKLPSRFKAKDAKGSEDAGNADLIDFIRNGPSTGSKGGTKVDKSIAPFRTTMDSDELGVLTDKVTGAIAAGSGTPASFVSRPNRSSISTTATGHTFSTFNSRAPLVGNKVVTSSAAPSISSALGGVSPSSEASTPRLIQDASPVIIEDDSRRQYRHKDTYAPASDNEEGFGTERKTLGGGNLSGHLVDTNGTSAKGEVVATTSHPSGLALNGIRFNVSSSATLDSSSLRPSRPTTGMDSSTSGSRPGSSKPKMEIKSPGSAHKAFAKQELTESSRQTRDLADLFNSAPPPSSGTRAARDLVPGDNAYEDDGEGAPAPYVGQKSGVADGKDKKSKFWKRSKRNAGLS